MKLIKLTQGLVAQVDDQDLWWLTQWKWYAKVKKRRGRALPYAERKEAKRTIIMHLAIAERHGLLEPGKEIDHIDGDGLNNQRSNLRAASPSQNQANQVPRGGTSKFKGVSWEKAKKLWRADIRVNGKRVCLGRFQTEEEAAQAYNDRAVVAFGSFARLNHI